MRDYPIECSESNCCGNCDNVLLADFDKSGQVDLYDMLLVIPDALSGHCDALDPPCPTDANGDGATNILDVLITCDEFGELACHWDLHEECSGCGEGCTYGNFFHCDEVGACIMHHKTDEFCHRCTDLIRLWLLQCFD